MRKSGLWGLFTVGVTALLFGCGTGGITTPDTTGGGGGGSAAGVTSVALVPSNSQLLSTADGTSGGAAGVTLTAIALDANNNVVANAPISFSACLPLSTNPSCLAAQDSARFGSAPAAGITPAGTVTGSDGTLQAILTTGGNPTLGTILVTAKAGTGAGAPTGQVLITVVSPPPASTGGGGGGGGGSTNTVVTTNLNIASSSTQLASDAITPAQGVTLTAFTTDANHNAISGVPVTFAASSGLLTVQNSTSDTNGQSVAILTTGGDSSTRCIDVTVTAPNSSTTTVSHQFNCGTLATGDQPGINVVNLSTGTPTPRTLTLIASSPQLSSSASSTAQGVTLTAQVKDANNNVLPGVTVSFSTPNSGAITVTQGTTDASGNATAILTTGGDPTNRVINITATTSNGVSNTTALSINVVGTTLTLTGSTTTQTNAASTYTAVLLDSGGAPIANKTISFTYAPGAGGGSGTFTAVSGTTTTISGLTATVTTNSSGQAPINLTPTGASATGTLTATSTLTSTPVTLTIAISTDCFTITAPTANLQVALGVSTPVTVSWKTGGCSGAAIANGTQIDFSSTRGTLTAASATTTSGTATVNISASQAGFATITASSNAGNKPSANVTMEFVATNPQSVNVQASPATVGTNQQSTITATVLDPSNNLVSNATVQFVLTDTTGGTLSAGQATTNSQGKAQVTYSATSTPSSANGVSITATVVAVQGTPLAPASQKSGSTTLTVGGAALHITLGTGNKLAAEGPGSGATTYVMPWHIQVTDSAGNPASTAQVSLYVHDMLYRKGISEFDQVSTTWIRTDGSGGSPIECTNEDLLTGNTLYDLNGVLDPGEDMDGNGNLTPDHLPSVPSTVALDSNGSADFEIRYPEDEAYWLRVRLRAIATVAGTESVSQVFFDLPGLSTDFGDSSNAPPGFESPYGVLQDCAHEQIANFTSPAQGVASGATAKAFVTLSSPAGNNAITIPFTIAATAGEVQNTNYTVTSPASCTTASCSITIPANGSSFEIDVQATSPAVAGDTVVLTLGTPASQAILGSTMTHTVVLGGAAVSFSSSGESASQTSSAPQLITVKLDRAVASNVTVPYSFSGTAVQNTNYVDNTGGSVTITAGTTSASISISPANNNETTSKSAVITLGAPTAGPAALGSPTTNTLTITP